MAGQYDFEGCTSDDLQTLRDDLDVKLKELDVQLQASIAADEDNPDEETRLEAEIFSAWELCEEIDAAPEYQAASLNSDQM